MLAQSLYGIGKIEVDRKACCSYAKAGITAFLGSPRGHIARHEIPEGRIATFEVIVATIFVQFGRFHLAFAYFLSIFGKFGNPDASVVAQTFAHQGQFRLVIAVHRNAGRMDLCETGIAKESALFVCFPDGTAIGSHGIR